MEATILNSKKLSSRNIEDIVSLFSESNQVDETKYVFDHDTEVYATYSGEEIINVISVFTPMRHEAELIAITKKEYRNRGYFNNLLEVVLSDLKEREIESVLLVCDNSSKDGLSVVNNSSFKYDFSEFLMEFKSDKPKHNNYRICLEEAREEDFNSLVYVNMDSFGTSKKDAENIIKENFNNDLRQLYSIKLENIIIGLIGIYKEPLRNYIYGFCIDKRNRNNGYGREALTSIITLCLEKSIDKKIVLEVQTENENALELYKSCGFKLETEFRYYRKDI